MRSLTFDRLVHLWQEHEVPGEARAGRRREQAQAEQLVAVAFERRAGEGFREDVGDVVFRADLAEGDDAAGDGAADHGLAGRHPASLLRNALGGDAVQDCGRIGPEGDQGYGRRTKPRAALLRVCGV